MAFEVEVVHKQAYVHIFVYIVYCLPSWTSNLRCIFDDISFTYIYKNCRGTAQIADFFQP